VELHCKANSRILPKLLGSAPSYVVNDTLVTTPAVIPRGCEECLSFRGFSSQLKSTLPVPVARANVNVPVRSAHAEHHLLNLKDEAVQRHTIAQYS